MRNAFTAGVVFLAVVSGCASHPAAPRTVRQAPPDRPASVAPAPVVPSAVAPAPRPADSASSVASAPAPAEPVKSPAPAPEPDAVDEAPVANDVEPIASFEDHNEFDGGQVVAEHATHGTKALRIDRNWVVFDRPQDWTGWDYVKADVHTDAAGPQHVYFEVRDRETRDYWTRVNYNTVVPPGSSTLVIPTALYVGEKSRPGRPLILDGITRMVYSVGEKPAASLYIDNVRLERDTYVRSVVFDGLRAFDLGPADAPLMEGFTPLGPDTQYTRERGYGLRDARVWRAYNVLQPEPLYQDFLCIESGGVAIDVPNGTYRVFVNQDSASGYWGEYQTYTRRSVTIEGVERVDTMDLESFRAKYYRFWDSEDLPTEDTFDKYQEAYFDEKTVDVEVTDGQLNVEFSGNSWANCVSTIVAFPHSEMKRGTRFLKFMVDRRRFHFDNYFKRVLHVPTGVEPRPTADEVRAGFVVFRREYMRDVYYNDRPEAGESVTKLAGAAFPAELEPVTFSLYPLRDLGEVRVEVSALSRPGAGSIPAGAVRVGYVVNRLSRVTMEGSVYTIAPRSVMPRASAPVPAGLTRRFWLTVAVPPGTPAGTYTGTVAVRSSRGGETRLPFEFEVYAGTLDELDVPAGPWGHTIDLPWRDGEAVRAWNDRMAVASLGKLREYGLTTCSGLPYVAIVGAANGVVQLDFSRGDAQMARLKAAGFTMPVVTYCGFGGLDLYYQDAAAMKRCGFTEYSAFVKAVFGAVQSHATQAGWLPVYWNLADEPVGDNLVRSAENAEAYRRAFPAGPPWFTGASSMSGADEGNPHFRLAKALHVVDWNGHDEASVRLLQRTGGAWAFYNSGNRWTYGYYLYKAAREFDLKFRLSWHWNVVAGDPYYALDCREDDYAWCNSSPTGELVPSVHFERDIREGVDDYRYLLTLARLVARNPRSTAAIEGARLIDGRIGSFELGQRDHDALFGAADWQEWRVKLARAIARLR